MPETQCKECNGTGWLHGCQNWNESYLKKHKYNPYYSKQCECSEKNKQTMKMCATSPRQFGRGL